MGMIFGEMGFNMNVVPKEEPEYDSCVGCIYEKHNTESSCELNDYLVKHYDFSCSEHKAILVEEPLLVLKKL